MTFANKGFEGLVAQLGESFAKAQAIEDDSKIEAAAGDAGVAAADAGDDDANVDAAAGGKVAPAEDGKDGKAKAEAEGEGEGEGDPEQFGKSFRFTLDNGEEVEAFDGAELLKSFDTKLEAVTAGAQSALQGALAVINKQNDVIEKQGVMLKSLQGEMTKLANAGTGRKSIAATQAGQENFGKSHAAAATPQEMLAKCLPAQSAGRISAFDSSRANVAVEMGYPIPADIVARLV